MKSKFPRKKSNIKYVLLFLCGLFLIGLYVFLRINDPEQYTSFRALLYVGVVICVVLVPLRLWNHGAFIHVDDDGIKARYNWFGRIDCKMSDVEFAMARPNTLVIRLKNGKCHTIMGRGNPAEIAVAIRRRMPFESQETSDTLIEKLRGLKLMKRKNLVYVCWCSLLIFFVIFVAVFLTGGKDFQEFSRTDRIVFAIMCVIELLVLALTFVFAKKAGSYSIPIEETKYCICRTVVETAPVLLGNILKVYTDDYYFGRITIFGFPNEDEVYCSLETLDEDFNLIERQTTAVYEDQVDVLSDYEESGMIDLTDKLLH